MQDNRYVTGREIQDILASARNERDALRVEAIDSLYRFENEEKRPFEDVMKDLFTSESRLAGIQTLQTRYNMAVHVPVQGREVLLQDAIRRAGGAKRIEELWSNAARNRGEFVRRETRSRSIARSRENEYARRTVSMEQCREKARTAGKYLRSISRVIQTGNESKMEVSESEANLFENN